MKNNKTGFSPWHTKQDSFDEDHQDLSNTLPSSKLSTKNKHSSKSKKQTTNSSLKKTLQIEFKFKSKIVRSSSKTESLAFPKEEEHPMNLTQRKFTNRAISSRRPQKTGRQIVDTLNEPVQLFDDQKWKMLTIASNEMSVNENTEVKKYQRFVEELKSRRTKAFVQKPFSAINVQIMRQKDMECENLVKNQIANSPIPLQQIPVKNFVMHGHLSDRQFIAIQQNNKRRQGVNFALKQKFATLKKNQSGKQNGGNSGTIGRRNTVQIGGKNNKGSENLFDVIKLERKINNEVFLDTKVR